MKLKTLKDIKSYVDIRMDDEGNTIAINDLRQAAREWVEELKKEKHYQEWVVIRGLDRWIQYFFNLEEE